MKKLFGTIIIMGLLSSISFGQTSDIGLKTNDKIEMSSHSASVGTDSLQKKTVKPIQNEVKPKCNQSKKKTCCKKSNIGIKEE